MLYKNRFSDKTSDIPQCSWSYWTMMKMYLEHSCQYNCVVGFTVRFIPWNTALRPIWYIPLFGELWNISFDAITCLSVTIHIAYRICITYSIIFTWICPTRENFFYARLVCPKETLPGPNWIIDLSMILYSWYSSFSLHTNSYICCCASSWIG